LQRPKKRTQNEPNSKPIKANFQNAQNERNLIYNKGLRQKMAFQAQKNKANSKPISNFLLAMLYG